MALLEQVTPAVIFMVILGGILATVIALAVRKLYVHEDPRINDVEEMLPAANCGACGYPGCRAFAEAVVKGEAPPSKCTVNTAEANQDIADFLGVALGQQEKIVARLACAGGTHVAKMRARYAGVESCRGAVAAGGGGKACAWGCLGLGDCDESCTFDAIYMNEFGLPVVIEDKCTACNDCVIACPLDLFSLHPVSHKLWVACKNLQEGDAALAECEVACNACGRCAMDLPEVIRMENNLAVVDYSKNDQADPVAIERCPTGAIVWLEKDRAIKGAAAKKIVRKTPLPIGDG